MADVIYKKGQSANLDDVTIADGQILVTEDTGEMYVDMSDGIRKKISDTQKQNVLISGENIKTINGESILGGGNIIIEGGSGTEIRIDQSYSPDSDNAQSGKAVAEGLRTKADRNKIFDYITYEINNNTVTITGCDTSISGSHIIPSTIEGYPVTIIGMNAFENCTGITSIIIPKGITSLYPSAFYGCSNLTSIEIPDTVNNMGYDVFSGCTKLKEVSFNAKITSLYGGTFDGCTSLTSIVIPNGVIDIATDFYNCSSLKTITIPDSVTSIGYDAFYNCTSLTDVYYSGTQEQWNSIDIDNHNDSLLNATIHFNQELATKEFVLNNGGSGSGTVDQTYNPESENAQSGKAVAEGLRTKADRNKIFDYITYEINNNQVTITGCYTSISGSHIIPSTIEGYPVTSIGDSAFEDCSSLKSIKIPNNVTSIGYRAFYSCISLTSITIPDSVTYIGESAFLNCGNLANVYYGGSQEQWEEINISGENDILSQTVIHYNQELATKEFVLNNSGSGGTVDQTYNPESENAQSGKAVAEAIDNLATKNVNEGTLDFRKPYVHCVKLPFAEIQSIETYGIDILKEPEEDTDAATKGYVDTAIAVEKNKSTNGAWTTRKPFITFTADDGYAQDISILEPIFKKYNIPCCIAMISTQINNLEKRLDLQNNHGWEVICHSTNSTPFTEMTLTEAETAMVTSKETLESLGFVIKDVAYPSGMCNSQIKQIAKKYFRAGYEFNPHETTSLNTGILDSFSIFRVPLGSFTNGSNYSTLDYYKSCVDNAVANNGWLIFCLHSGASAFDATQQQYLDDLLAYIQSLGVETGNLSAGYEVFGNYIECGASANTSIPRTDAELLRFVVSNTGEHNLPIFKTMNLIHTNTDPLTAYPENKISISEISNYNAGFPLERGGTLITSRFDYFGFQIWLPDYVNHIYKRSWNSNAWRPWSKISTESADSLFSKRLYCSNNWSGNFNVSISNSLYIRTFDIIGSQKPTLTKQYFALSEISTDRDNPTIIGTTENGVSIQMCYLQDNYLYFKYGSELSNNAYIEIAYS